MALSDEQIKIIIAAELKKQGFDKAKKATNQLEDNFKKLGRTVATVFSVAVITKFAKESVRAFKEEEVAANRFEQALKGVNLGFATPAIEDYLESLERATAVTKGELRPAFQTLAQTTRSINKSQDILATALDVSAGSGYDLQTVVNDLSRAYLGNNTSLSKYNIGLTKAELRTTRFNDVQELLNKQFAGQKAAQLDTYAGKVSFISAAYERMQTTVGEGLVDAFGMLSGENGIAGATGAMEEFGTITADVFRGLGYYIGLVTSQFGGKEGLMNRIMGTAMTGNPLAALIVALQKAGQKQNALVTPFYKLGIGQPGIDAKNRAIEEAAIKRQKELEALRLKSIKQQEKINRLKQISQKIDKAASKFDERRIQIAAALQGNISDEERRRLLELQTIEDLKQAIQEQDVDKAEKLLERLDKLQSQTETLAETLVGLEAGDPFAKWETYFDKADALVNGLVAKLRGIQSEVNKLLEDAQARSMSAAANVFAAQQDKATAYKEAARATAVSADIAASQAASAIAEATAQLGAARTPEQKAQAQAFLEGANAAADAAKVLQESVVAAEEAAALAELNVARNLEQQGLEAMLGAGVPAQTIINMYVEGNAVTTQDLADTITDLQYNQQRSGRRTIYSARAI
jgi:hypothetical protein